MHRMRLLIHNTVLQKALLIALIALSLLQLTTHFAFGPIDFDEGYNMQLVQKLSDQGAYATHDKLLDEKITTGPMLLIPASVFANLTSHPLAPRMATVMFSLFFMWILLKGVYKSDLERIGSLILLSIVPLFYFFATVTLGEMPGFTLVLFGYALIARGRYGWAALTLSLATLIKTTYFFALIPITSVPLIQILLKNNQKDFHIFSFFTQRVIPLWGTHFHIFTIPHLLFELFRFAQVGFDTGTYAQVWQLAVEWGKSQGAWRPDLIGEKLNMFQQVLGFGAVPIVLFASFWVYLLTRERDRVGKSAVLLAHFALIWIMYHLLLGATAWYRHAFAGVLALIITLPVGLRFIGEFSKRQIITTVCVLAAPLLIVGTLLTSRDDLSRFHYLTTRQNLLFLDQSNMPYRRPKQMLSDQYATATFITSSLKGSGNIAGLGWYNAPQISYLANRKIERQIGPKTRFVIVDMWARYLDEAQVETFLKSHKTTPIHQNATYTVYRVESEK